MSRLLEQKAKLANLGRIYFMEWLQQFDVSDQDAIWLFTELDDETAVFLKYLKPFKQQYDYERIHIILPENITRQPSDAICDPCHYVPLHQILAVIKLYETYIFSSRLFICDFDKPEGRKGRNMLFSDIKCDIDQLVAIGILGLKGAIHEN